MFGLSIFITQNLWAPVVLLFGLIFVFNSHHPLLKKLRISDELLKQVLRVFEFQEIELSGNTIITHTKWDPHVMNCLTQVKRHLLPK